MKRLVILVTGFGAFPGAPKNPTAVLMRRLAASEKRLERLGIKLERRIFPVVYNEIAPKLAMVVEDCRPDAIIHFGLAGKRRPISIETRAVNRMGLLHPDARGRLAHTSTVLPENRFSRAARVPVRAFAGALRLRNIACRLSIDAGDYICNQTFYLSLAMTEGTNRSVGFIHVPRLRSSNQLKQQEYIHGRGISVRREHLKSRFERKRLAGRAQVKPISAATLTKAALAIILAAIPALRRQSGAPVCFSSARVT